MQAGDPMQRIKKGPWTSAHSLISYAPWNLYGRMEMSNHRHDQNGWCEKREIANLRELLAQMKPTAEEERELASLRELLSKMERTPSE
jgi:hypothetical protein